MNYSPEKSQVTVQDGSISSASEAPKGDAGENCGTLFIETSVNGFV
jgi:hypothetical protein